MNSKVNKYLRAFMNALVCRNAFSVFIRVLLFLQKKKEKNPHDP